MTLVHARVLVHTDTPLEVLGVRGSLKELVQLCHTVLGNLLGKVAKQLLVWQLRYLLAFVSILSLESSSKVTERAVPVPHIQCAIRVGTRFAACTRQTDDLHGK